MLYLYLYIYLSGVLLSVIAGAYLNDFLMDIIEDSLLWPIKWVAFILLIIGSILKGVFTRGK